MTETTKQNLAILIITILLAASVLIAINYLRPNIKKAKSLELDIKSTQKKIALLQDYKAKAEALVNNYTQLGDQINKINLALPTNPNAAQVIASLNAISQSHHILLTNLSFQEGKDKNVSYLGIKTSFTTSYDNFKQWLADIEKEIRIIDIQKATIKFTSLPSSSHSRRHSHSHITSSPLSIAVNLRCYYLPLSVLNAKGHNTSGNK